MYIPRARSGQMQAPPPTRVLVQVDPGPAQCCTGSGRFQKGGVRLLTESSSDPGHVQPFSGSPKELPVGRKTERAARRADGEKAGTRAQSLCGGGCRASGCSYRLLLFFSREICRIRCPYSLVRVFEAENGSENRNSKWKNYRERQYLNTNINIDFVIQKEFPERSSRQ